MKILKRIILVMTCLCLSLCFNFNYAMADENSSLITNPEEISFNQELYNQKTNNDINPNGNWYKLDIPQGTKPQNIIITTYLDRRQPLLIYATIGFYNEHGEEIDHSYLYSDSYNKFIVNITKDMIGKTYYINVYDKYDDFEYNISVKGSYDKESKLSTIIRKGNSFLDISTLPDATISIKVNDKILKSGGSTDSKLTVNSGSGDKEIKLKRKLKKGDKITIIVKKSGYETKKKTVKII